VAITRVHDRGTGGEMAGPALSVGSDRAMCCGRLPWAVVAPVMGHAETVGRRRDKGRPTRAGGGRVAVAAGGALVAGRLIKAGACVSEGAGEGSLGTDAGEGVTCASGGKAGSEEPMMRGSGKSLCLPHPRRLRRSQRQTEQETLRRAE